MNSLDESDDNKDSTLETGQPFNLQKTWRSSFHQGLQLVRCFDFDPGTPITAAIFCLLFQRLKITPSLEKLHLWLDNYISSFATDSPRNQSDQAEKVLAIAVYLHVCDQEGFQTRFPDKNLIAHITYAHNQAWLSNPFLAFYCHNLKTSVTVCENVDVYFKENFERFVAKRHIPSICQALLILGNQLPPTDQERGYREISQALSEQKMSLNHAAWGLMALSSISTRKYQFEIEQLIARIDSELTEFIKDLFQEARLPGLLTLLWSGADHVDLRRYQELFPTRMPESSVKVDFDNPDMIGLSVNCSKNDNEGVVSRFSYPSPADIALALIALHSAQAHNLVGVAESDTTRLVSSLQKIEDLEREGAVVLSRQENILSNLLAITITFVVGLIIGLFFLGIKLNYSLDFSEVSYRDFDVVIFMVVWIDFMIAQIQTLVSGQAAVKGMLQFPLIRHLPTLRQYSSRLFNTPPKEE